MDVIIGAILNTLKEIDEYDNTLIIFMSDNGAWINPSNGLNDASTVSPFDGGSNGVFRGGKGSTWEGGIRVPLLVKPPLSTTTTTKHILTPTTATDLLPTIMDYAGAPLNSNYTVDGVSLRPLLETGGSLEPRCIYHWRENDLYAIRCGALKAHFITRSGFNISDVGELHDPPIVYKIEEDPGENFPVVAGEFGVTADDVAFLIKMGNEHRREMEKNKSESLYLKQRVDVMPCCTRGGLGEIELDNDDDVPRIWKHCVCERII